MSAHLEELDFVPKTAADVARANTVAELSRMVTERFNAASGARQASGVTDKMLKCRRAQEGKPLSGVHVDPDLPIVFNIIASITRGITAMFRDAINSSAENMFSVQSTGVPDIPLDMQAKILDRLSAEQSMALQLGIAPDQDQATIMAAAMIELAIDEAKREAEEAAGHLTEAVRDEFQENGWREAVHDGLHDLVSDVCMVLKSPSTRINRTRSWVNGELIFKDEVVRAVERVAPINFYPSPNASTVHDADYIIELRTASSTDLLMLAQDDGYDSREIMRALVTHKDGFKICDGDGVSTMMRDHDQYSLSNSDTPGTFQLLVHNGLVRGTHLKNMGINVLDEMRSYESEIVTIGHTVIRAVLNPSPSARRPYHVISYDPIPGKLFGDSPATRLFDIQRAATSCFVAMIGDLSLAGLHIEVDPNKLHEDDRLDASAVRPRVVRVTKGTDGSPGSRAFNIHAVQPHTESFRAELDHLEQKAYDLVGVPRMAMGQTTGAGTIGRTADGVKTMLNQMLKVLKSVLLNIEVKVIEPIIQESVDWNMQWNKNIEIRGDARVMARGITGLIEQADKVDDLQWALQSISSLAGQVDPSTGQPYSPGDAPTRILYQMFKARGIPTKGMFAKDFDGIDADEAIVNNSAGFEQDTARPGTALETSQSGITGVSNGI